MDKFLITFSSANRITGDMMVTTSPRASCPATCSLRGATCYAERGHLGHWLWNHLDATPPNSSGRIRVYNFHQLLAVVRLLAPGTVWRHNQAGDLPHDNGIIRHDRLLALIDANRGKHCFTFTHHDVLSNAANRVIVRQACDQGFMINLSADDLDHADALADLAIAPVAVLVPADRSENTRTRKGRTVAICPARRRQGVTCATCQICTRPHKAIIGFPEL